MTTDATKTVWRARLNASRPDATRARFYSRLAPGRRAGSQGRPLSALPRLGPIEPSLSLSVPLRGYLPGGESTDRRRERVLRAQIDMLAKPGENGACEDVSAPDSEAIDAARRLLSICIDRGFLPERFFLEPAGGLGAVFIPDDAEGGSDHEPAGYATIGFENDGAAALMIDDRSEEDIIAEDIEATDEALRRAISRIELHFGD